MLNLLNKYFASYRGLPKQAWMLFFVILVNRSGMMVVFFMTLYLTQELHFSSMQAGQLVSIFGVGSLIGSYLGGWLTDRIGSYRVQLYSLIFTGLTMFVLGMMRSYFSIAVMLVVVATLNDALRPASITAFAEICPPEMRARAFSFNRLAVNLGVAIGPAVGGLLVTIHYGLIFWVDGITCLISGVLFFILFRKNAPRQSVTAKESGPLSKSPWKDAFFILLMLVFMSIGIIFFQLFNTWPLFLKEFALLSEPKIGLLLTINAIMIVLIEMPLIHKMERFSPLKVAIVGTVFIIMGFWLLNVNTHYAFIIFTVMLWTLGEILAFPMTAAVVANRSSDQNRGVYMGIYTTTFSLSFVIGPALGSWVYDTWGATMLWNVVGVAGIVILLAFLRFYFWQKRLP